MKRILWVLGFLTISATCMTQTFEDQQRTLRDALVKKTFCLRGFSADSEVNFVWTGTSLEGIDAAVHTFGAIKISDVKVTPDKVEIDGTRRTLLIKKDQALVPEGMDTPIKLIVTLRKVAPETLSRLPDLLFYPNEQKALADVPEEFRRYIPAPFDTVHMSEKIDRFGDTPPCDCSNNDANLCGRQPKSPGWVNAKTETRFTRPPIPQEARVSKKQDITGSEVYRIDENGHTSDFWIALPAGFGMDEEVLRMLLHVTFKPATCHDKPVAVTTSHRFDLHLTNTSPH